MLPVVSSFFKDTFNENLKKLVQPSSLVVAAIFLSLHFFFILPLLLERNDTLATTFVALDEGWQIVVGVLLTLVLGYLFLSLNSTILKLMTGELWVNSILIGPVMKSLQARKAINWEIDYLRRRAERDAKRDHQGVFTDGIKEHTRESKQHWEDLTKLELAIASGIYIDGENERTRLVEEKEQGKTKWDRLKEQKKEYAHTEALIYQYRQKVWEYKTTFPKNQGDVAATSLGNVLNATSSYIWGHYNLDMTALWPHMETAIAENKAMTSRIENEKAALDFLVNLSFVLALFSFEYLLFLASVHRIWWPNAALSFMFLFLSYITYRAAVSKARTWGDAVQIAFDMCREDLRKSLNIREFKSKEDERQVWERVSRWLLFGDVEEWKERGDTLPDDVFESAPAAPSQHLPSVTTSPNISYKLEYGISDLGADERIPDQSASNRVMIYRKRADYLILVSNATQQAEECNCAADGAYVIVHDSQVPLIRSAPVADANAWAAPDAPVASLVPAADRVPAYKLLWPLGRLEVNSARALRYAVEIPIFEAKTNSDRLLVLEKITEGNDDVTFQYRYEFEITSSEDSDVEATLDVYDGRIKKPADAPVGVLTTPDGTMRLVKAESLSQPDRYRWSLGKLSQNNRSVTLSYMILK